MIKINLAKVRKEKASAITSFDLSSLKNLRVQELFKAGGEYYAGAAAWLAVVAILGYHWKIAQEKEALKAEVDRLKAEKMRLESQAKGFLERKNQIEERISTLRKEIQDIERSKDIVIGLKSYYIPFNSGFHFYTAYAPKASWIKSYKQTLDMHGQTLKVELDVNSLDYSSLGAYGSFLAKNSQKVTFTSLERNVNPYGFEYYTMKVTAEKSLENRR
ncbi:MAG: hypothetical protein NZ526_02615 [Aquificaceae bacterium]|nr:hypothetical protein [Aquificaceae bacterium]